MSAEDMENAYRSGLYHGYYNDDIWNNDYGFRGDAEKVFENAWKEGRNRHANGWKSPYSPNGD